MRKATESEGRALLTAYRNNGLLGMETHARTMVVEAKKKAKESRGGKTWEKLTSFAVKEVYNAMTTLRGLIPKERKGEEGVLGALYNGYVAFHNKYYLR